MGGVVTASAVLIGLVMLAGAFGWSQVDQTWTTVNGVQQSTTQFPGWMLATMLLGFGAAIFTIFKPLYAKFTAPVYALLMGATLGAISAVYNIQYNGIVLQAIAGTIGVFMVMLFLYASRIVRVTDRLRIGVIAATGGVFVAYLISWVFSLFSHGVPSIFNAGPVGIIFSLVVVGVASFNLLLDFDFIDHGVEARFPKGMEWYAAFGLVVTLVWLYIEMLRLLSKLRQ
jgi:uncharacterized YccA/Bax inhibitor family protein